MSLLELKETYDFVSSSLIGSGNLGLINTYEELATKTLIIAAAGKHEKEISKILIEMSRTHQSPIFISNFISNAAIKRRYHSLFDWNAEKINSFAGLFGEEKKAELIQKCKNCKGTKDFFYIGATRNRIVHKGLATESINKTFSEVWDIYISSNSFLDLLVETLHLQPGLD